MSSYSQYLSESEVEARNSVQVWNNNGYSFRKSSLNSAAMRGDIEKVKTLISKGADINKRGRKSWTPLHVAAKHGHHEIVRFLLQNGALIDVTITEAKGCGFTALHLAALKNHLECAQVLLENGASVSPKTDDVSHPIHIAVFKGHVKMAALLLDYGADVNLRFDDRFFKGFKQKMSSILWENHNLPLLHCSILKKFDQMTKLLLNRGADVNFKTSLEKTTLMQAIEVNDHKLVKLLIEQGANVNDRDIFGQPVLHFTIINANRRNSTYCKIEYDHQEEKLEIVKQLVKNGANVSARFPANRDHATVIHYMIICGFHLLVEYLLHKCHFNYKEIDLKTVFSGQLKMTSATLDIASDGLYIRDLEDSFESITYSIMQWAISRQMIGLPVNKAIILKHPIHHRIDLHEYTREINSYEERITEQINYMKETKIGDSNVTFWHLLNSGINKLVVLMANKSVNFFDSLENSRCKLFNYFDFLKKRLTDAKKRRTLLEESSELIFKCFGNQLPYDCCVQIVNCLNDGELEIVLRS